MGIGARTLPLVPEDANAESESLLIGNDEGRLDIGALRAHKGTPEHPGGQDAIIRAALSNYCVTVLNGRSSGKTWCLILLLHEEGMRQKGRYEFAYVAPSHKQAAQFYRTIKKAYAGLIVGFCDKGQDRWVEIAPFGENDGAVVNCWSGEPGALDNIRGPRLNRLAVDEAPLVHKAVLSACVPMLTGRKGKMIFEGTARRGGCGNKWFGEMIARARNGEPGFVTFNMPTESSPYNDPKDVARDRRLFRDPNAPDIVTPEEREEFDGEIISDVGAYFRNLDKCITLPVIRNEPGLYIFEEPIPGDTYVIGQDFGSKKDHSVSACFNRRTRNMAALRVEPSGESVQFDPQLARLDALKKRYNNALVIADPIGVGAYIVQRLRIQFGDHLRELGLQGKGENSKDLHCARVRHMLDVEGMHLGNVPVLREQFEAFAQIPIGETANGYRFMGADGVHDDVVAAVIYAASVLQIDPAPRPISAPTPEPMSVGWFRAVAGMRAAGARRVRW